ncbi:TPA: YfcE family phosphodiesterase [Candidatus Bathyarchaeota archaeon]|nr:YfcE family phosphodiesterase [Candidatus Bathyarchaeota archaeon]
MKIVVISDTHDREAELKQFIKMINKDGIKVLIHCGDFCAPFMIKALAEFEREVHCVFGNTDDRYISSKLAKKRGINLHGDFAQIEIEGRKIAFIHDDVLGRLLAETNKFDAVFHGHHHKSYQEKVSNTLLANPGEMAGLNGIPTYGVYDTDKNEIEIKEFK